MQNCTILQYFMVHAAHGVKAYQVNFPTHRTPRQLVVPRWSYCQNTQDCAEDQQSCRNFSRIHFMETLSQCYLIIFISCLHLSRRSLSCIIPHFFIAIEEFWESKYITTLFSYVLTNLESDLYPLCSCGFLRRITEAAASSTPNWCSCSLWGFLDWL